MPAGSRRHGRCATGHFLGSKTIPAPACGGGPGRGMPAASVCLRQRGSASAPTLPSPAGGGGFCPALSPSVVRAGAAAGGAEDPVRFDLIVNLKTAGALGIELPHAILRAPPR